MQHAFLLFFIIYPHDKLFFRWFPNRSQTCPIDASLYRRLCLQCCLSLLKVHDCSHDLLNFYFPMQAEKLYTPTLPYPFTSQELFEGSIRMPIGPEFNPGTAVPALIRPEVCPEAYYLILVFSIYLYSCFPEVYNPVSETPLPPIQTQNI